ncbi:hypothetical protein ABE545_09920 [Sphingobacterium faecium]|jgi:hypothetical protein|uniref:hypothetical protein n=1 Tax=Sphingobacterium faecium TaxID=34087 RepID=UPI00320B7F93
MKLKFLTCSLLLAVTGMGTTFNNVQAQEQIRTKEIGLQLYSVRSMIGSHVQPDTYNADYFSVLQKLELLT